MPQAKRSVGIPVSWSSSRPGWNRSRKMGRSGDHLSREATALRKQRMLLRVQTVSVPSSVQSRRKFVSLHSPWSDVSRLTLSPPLSEGPWLMLPPREANPTLAQT